MELIKYLEISLYGEKRNNTNWLNTVLHDDLLEISKSGYVYTKKNHNQALRSSIWQLSSNNQWQLRFHQGTLMAK
ncbi:hypothetical protein HZS38_05595 [Xenorhabdus nematophila]|nr:hypothetical protein D3790_05690 [Xenorhabdus nematophila]MBA0018664.1 hypothetical protein [Xenorhabdus nematophila]MCB4426909.1 hypothetical protein [Xenorhabdus nematophila]QNJ38312.1 hypothetical protein H8F46_05625 [Xenorhabdus nematophila]